MKLVSCIGGDPGKRGARFVASQKDEGEIGVKVSDECQTPRHQSQKDEGEIGVKVSNPLGLTPMTPIAPLADTDSSITLFSGSTAENVEEEDAEVF